MKIKLILFVSMICATASFSENFLLAGDFLNNRHKVRLAPAISYSFNSANFNLLEPLSQKDLKFNEGSGFAYNLALAYSYQVNGFLALGITGGYEIRKSTFNLTDYTSVNLAGKLEPAEFSYTFSSNSNYLILKPSLDINLIRKLDIEFGLGLGFQISNDTWFEKKIVKPDWATFADKNVNTYQRYIKEAIKPEPNNIVPFIEVNLSYQLWKPISNSISLSPFIGFSTNMGNIYRVYPWSNMNVKGGVNITWNFNSAEIKKTEPIKLEKEPVNTTGKDTTAFIAGDPKRKEAPIENKDQANPKSNKISVPTKKFATKQTEKTLSTHIIPIINRVFFLPDNSEIISNYLAKSRDIKLSENGKLSDFLLFTHYLLLDTLCSRYIRLSNHKISLIGIYTKNEGKVLAIKRAKHLRDAIISNYGINENEIVIGSKKIKRSKNKPLQEYDYVELKVNNDTMLNPMIFSLDKNHPIIVGLDPSIGESQQQTYFYYFFDYNRDVPSYASGNLKVSGTLTNTKIVGFTDQTGEPQQNQNLSVKRAKFISDSFFPSSFTIGLGALPCSELKNTEYMVISRVAIAVTQY